jgi:Endomembrane protein 70
VCLLSSAPCEPPLTAGVPRARLQGPTHLRPGYELGAQSGKDFYVFNHLVFNVLIHQTDGSYTRSQSSAFASSLAVDTSGRRLLAWHKGTPAEARAVRLRACDWSRVAGQRIAIVTHMPRGSMPGNVGSRPAPANAVGSKSSVVVILALAHRMLTSCSMVLSSREVTAAQVVDALKERSARQLLKDKGKLTAEQRAARKAKRERAKKQRVRTHWTLVSYAALQTCFQIRTHYVLSHLFSTSSDSNFAVARLVCTSATIARLVSDARARTLQDADEAAAARHDEMWMIVGFEVMPCSIKRTFGDAIQPVSCKPWPNEANPAPQPIEEGADIVYSYDVFWDHSDIEWASRWDLYLRMPNGSVHWFSILNSLLVVLVMSVIVAVILMRTVRRDLAKYEELLIEGGDGGGKEESGWKLLSGDVFRAPSHLPELAVQARAAPASCAVVLAAPVPRRERRVQCSCRVAEPCCAQHAVKRLAVSVCMRPVCCCVTSRGTRRRQLRACRAGRFRHPDLLRLRRDAVPRVRGLPVARVARRAAHERHHPLPAARHHGGLQRGPALGEHDAQPQRLDGHLPEDRLLLPRCACFARAGTSHAGGNVLVELLPWQPAVRALLALLQRIVAAPLPLDCSHSSTGFTASGEPPPARAQAS